MDFVRMIFLLFSAVVFAGTSSGKGMGEEELMGESLSREEVVNWAGYGEDRLSTVVIHGKLFCHSTFDDVDQLSAHPFPVSGASVAVFCGTSRKTKKSWARGSTDSNGKFIIDIPSDLHAIPNLEKICLVKVIHLPKSCPCRHAFTGKHKAIKLTSISEGLRTYTTNNIHLMPKPSSKERTGKGAKTERKMSIL